MRLLCLLCAIFDITLVAKHTPGAQNTSADALSRDQLSPFLSINPQATPVSAIIPKALQELVFNEQIVSTSKSWIELLTATLEAASRQPRAQPTLQPSGGTQDSARSSA